MKILIRDLYKMKPDELFCMGVDEEYANELCKMLNNSSMKLDGKYYQAVSDDFKIYLDK